MKQVTLAKQMILQPEVKINTNEKLDVLIAKFSFIDKGYNVQIDLGKIVISKLIKNMTPEQKAIYDSIEEHIKDLATSFINV